MMVRHASFATGLLLALALPLTACGGNEQPAKTPETTSTTSAANGPTDMNGMNGMNGTNGTGTPSTSATGATGTGNTAMGGGATATGTGTTDTANGGNGGSGVGSMSAGSSSGSSGSGSSGASTTTLSDDQIVAITAAANKGEVDEAKLAQQKAKDPRVKKFAAQMVTDHGGAITKQDALVKKNKITPNENSVSQQLQSDVQSTMTSLQSATGGDFDHAYIDAQVKQHQQVLDTIDQKLLPQVKNADLKAMLDQIRPKIEHHLKMAQDIQSSLK